MGLFGKSKKESSCCNVQFEEIKEENNKKNSCCDVKIEEVKEEKETTKKDDSCCGN
ncbi:MAG: hypothetical protein ACEPOZ_19720 [Marinifilaceae bacterium]